MKGREFIQKVRKLGRRRGIPVVFKSHRGKGSHGTLYYGDRFTVVKDRRKEIGPGLYRAMLKDLGIDRNDI